MQGTVTWVADRGSKIAPGRAVVVIESMKM
ncbi:MAG: hypothetical protein RLZ86_1631, partial [Actinomycetota bacterium]